MMNPVEAVRNDFIYIDCEMTGLDKEKHALLEVSYAVGDSEPVTFYPALPFDNFVVDHKAMEVNKWPERFGEDSRLWPNMKHDSLRARDWADFFVAAKDKTPVGLNVEFDLDFINYNIPVRFAPLPTHHRLLNLGLYLSGILLTDENINGPDLTPLKPVSGSNIPKYIERMILDDFGPEGGFGFLPMINHTAEGDVRATRFYHQYILHHYMGGPVPIEWRS